MNLKLAIGDYSFPKLELEQTLRLARDIGMQGMDIALFAGRSHLDSDEVLSDPDSMSLRLSTVHENSLLHLSHLFSASTSAIFMAGRWMAG